MKPQLRIGSYIETTYSKYRFRGYITSKDKHGRWHMVPSDGTILPHSQFTRHGDHICTDKHITLLDHNLLPEDLFTL